MLFNFIGYKLIFYFAIQQADRYTQNVLEQESYNDADLFTIEVPLSNPYQVSQSDFERISGEIELKGKIYHYVKRKIVNGNLVLMCLPDKKKTPLKSAERKFFNMVNNLDQTKDASKSSQNKAGIFKVQILEYEQYFGDINILNRLVQLPKCVPVFDSPVPSSPVTGLPGQPPDFHLI